MRNNDFEQAMQYYKNKNYKDAITIYENLWKHNKNEFTPTHRYYFAWGLYYYYIKNKMMNNLQRKHAAELVLQLVSQSDCRNTNQPCVYTRTVFSMIKSFKQHNDFFSVLEWLQKLNPNLLGTKPFRGKKGEFPSDKELWCLNFTNALYNTKKYNDCINFAKKALESVSFINNNDVWIRRNMALSLYCVKRYNDAIEQFKEILTKKKEWYIKYELARTYYENKEIALAFEYCLEAVSDKISPEKLIHVYMFLGNMLVAKNNLEYAIVHYQLAYRIIKDNGWNLTKIEPYINKYNIDINSIPSKEDLLKELRKIWNEIKYQNKPVYYGKIEKILPSGNGFVVAEDNESYFFNKKSLFDPHIQIQENLKVSFNIEDGYDPKKDKKTKVAVNIKVIPQ